MTDASPTPDSDATEHATVPTQVETPTAVETSAPAEAAVPAETGAATDAPAQDVAAQPDAAEADAEQPAPTQADAASEQDEPEEPAAPAGPTFDDIDLPAALRRAVDELGFTTPSAIQSQAIPPLLEGKDVIGVAQTGTGKTAAFGLPLLAAIDPNLRQVQALVLAPTRELAMQVADAIASFATSIGGLDVVALYGGSPYGPQERALARGAQVVVGTPGRVMDHMRRTNLRLDTIRFAVLDEADEMLRMGFAEDVEEILSHSPASRQVALFSATMPSAIQRVAQTHMKDPVRVSVSPQSSTVKSVSQSYAVVPFRHRTGALARVLATSEAEAAIVFVRTRAAAEEVGSSLVARGLIAASISGDVPQKEREKIVERLREGSLQVLVATDVAARGVHVDAIELVVHVDPPAEHKAYLHRSGRTARAGSEGDVVTLMLPSQRKDTEMLLRRAKIGVTPQRANVNSPFVAELVGEVAPTVRPVPGGPGSGNVEVNQGRGTSQGANARRKRDAAPARGGSARGGSGNGGGGGRGRAASSSSQGSSASRPARGQAGEGAAQGQRRGEGRPRRAGTSSPASPSRGGERGSRRASWSSGQ